MIINFTEIASDSEWVKSEVDDGEFTFEAKLYDEDSGYGIDFGRISKLSIYNIYGDWIVNYDRGWDIQPKIEHQEVYDSIIDFLESALQRF